MSSGSNSNGWGITVLRIVVGIVFLAHGYQKLFVYKIPGVIGLFTQMGVPVPSVSAVVVAFVEVLAGAALILGLATRLAALLLAVDMLGAIVFVHFKGGLFLPTGFEYDLTQLAANLCLALTGPGAASVDALLGKKSA